VLKLLAFNRKFIYSYQRLSDVKKSNLKKIFKNKEIYNLLTGKKFWGQLIREALNNRTEYNFLDFKLNLSDKTERLKEHINAFGNLERGGCFVFGVEKFVPVGTQDDKDAVIRKIVDLAGSTQVPSLNVDTFSVKIGNKNLLCLHILPGISKPVFIKDRAPLGGRACFKRSGSSTIAMQFQEIKDLLINAQENYYDESAIQDALRLQEIPNPTKDQVQTVTNRLKEYLPVEDPFWVRWIFYADSFGVSIDSNTSSN